MRSTLLPSVLAVTLLGCAGGNASTGESCSDNASCRPELQCFHEICVPRCERAPECGDGYRCDDDGLCHAATGQQGDACESEVDCAAGLSCQIAGTATTSTGLLAASCVAENAGRPAGDSCNADSACRNGTCDLGHCLDLCRDTIDCGAGTTCTRIPRVASDGLAYDGCLQATGSIAWSIPVDRADEVVPLPIPDSARGVSVTFSVEDPNQKVGAVAVTAPDNTSLLDAILGYYDNPVLRHRPEFGESVLAMPATPSAPLQPGIYQVRVRSQRPGFPTDLPGTAIPQVTAVIKVDTGAYLDLHFFFLDLAEHPCRQAFGGGSLDASTARTADFFQTTFLGDLRTLVLRGGMDIGTATYEDLHDHPDLDGLDVTSLPALLELGTYSSGVNVFFVRSLSPVGLQAVGPNPGPAGIGGTRQSGIVIGLDTLCYRSWSQLARITARELARYLGLHPNVEYDPNDTAQVPHDDPIPDTDRAETNLMFTSELGGSDITDGQRFVLTRSPALR